MSWTSFQVEYGLGGWLRLRRPGSSADLYLRLSLVGGYPQVAEVYAHDVEGVALPPIVFEGAGLDDLAKVAARGELDHIESRAAIPGPDIATLAQTFASAYSGASYCGRHCSYCGGPLKYQDPQDPERHTDDWTALSWFAQFPDSKIKRPKQSTRRQEPQGLGSPPPLHPPVRIDDAFLELVAQHYAWATLHRLRPAPTIAAAVHVSPRTVHDWVRRARAAGHIPPANRKTGEHRG